MMKLRGGSRDFIASLLDSIQELESKLDFKLLDSHTDSTPCHTERSEVSKIESHLVILSDSEKSKHNGDISPTAQYDKLINTANLNALLDSIPTPPKQGWERVRLGQVVSVQSGGTPSREVAEYWNGDINWIKSEVCQNCYVYENQVKEKITELGLKKSSAKILKKDSVLIALVGATIGKVGYLTFDSTTNQNIAGLYPLNSENLNTKFLYFACLGLYHLFTEKGGFTMANLTFIKNLKIPLPPIEAQEKIVSAIDSVESQIKRIDSKLEILEKRKAEVLANALNAGNEREREREQAELKKILSEIESLLSQRKTLQRFITTILQKAGLTQSLESLIDSLPTPPAQGWNTIKLNNKKYLTLNPSKREIANIDENTIISFVEMASVADKGYIQNKVDKPLKELRKGSYTYFAENDILIAKITPCMENGKCAIAKNLANGLGMGSSEFHIFRTHKGLNNKFLFACLNQDSIRQEAAKNMTGSSGHRRVPISFYESLQIPLPPLEAQEKIINAIESVESKIHLLDSRLPQLDSKKSEILQHFLEA